MRRIIYISFLLMFFCAVAHAQKKIIYEDTSLLQREEVAAPVEDFGSNETTAADESYFEDEEPAIIDTTLYQNNLYVSYDSVKKWRDLKAYAYTKYLDSLLKNQKEEKVVQSSRSNGSGILNSILGSGIISVLLWTFVICFILFIVYRLFLADGVFKRKPQSDKNDEANAMEEIISSESDFDAHIRQALQQGNYRQAVRYQYLRTLHGLAAKSIIELAPDKTNYHYVNEITNSSYRNDFASLTLNYEYVWYGGFDIDKPIYQKIENDFISLNQKL